MKAPRAKICLNRPLDFIALNSGDSGGPLVVPKSSRDNSAIVIGLTSFGYKKGCGYERMPDVFTNVIKYVDWIKDRMEHNLSPSGKYRVSSTM